MGTPAFSVPPLKALAEDKTLEICLVVTPPDRPKGRGKKRSPSAVKTAAQALGLPIYQPERLNTQEGKEKLAALSPDYFVVVAFGQILSQDILDIPRIYPINIHASLLPQYRGAAPIQAAVMNMDKQTGVTTMVMAKGMDTGDILLKSATPIDPGETAQDLHDRLSQMGAALIVETIHKVNAKTLTPIPQDHDHATYVSMLKKSDGEIDWGRTDKEVCAHINAMTPWPSAFTHLGEKRLKIFKAVPGPAIKDDAVPGDILACTAKGISVATGQNTVLILELMGFSGKHLTADAFLRGHQIDLPARFS